MRATITLLGCGAPPIDPSRVLALMADEGLVCSHQLGQRRLEFNCYGEASAFRRFASRALGDAGKLRHHRVTEGGSPMTLQHVSEVAWSNLRTAWDYPFPIGMIFLASALLIVAGLAMTLRGYVESRQRTPE